MTNNVAVLHEHTPPAQRDRHNWDAIKMRYELLGENLEDIAREYSITLSFLERLSTAETWTRQSVPEIQTAIKDDDASSLIESVRTRVDVIQVYKELALMPALLEIESSLVANLKTALSDTKKRSPKDMKLLVDSFTALTARQKILSPEAPTSTVPKVSINLDTSLGASDVD